MHRCEVGLGVAPSTSPKVTSLQAGKASPIAAPLALAMVRRKQRRLSVGEVDAVSCALSSWRSTEQTIYSKFLPKLKLASLAIR